MNKDKKILYIVSLSALAILLLLLLADFGSGRITGACALILISAATLFAIRKKSSLSIHRKEVLMLSAIFAVIYVVLVQMSGLFFGYYLNPYTVNQRILFAYVVPITVIIVGSELFRARILAQKNAFAALLAYFSCVIAETLSFSNIAEIKNFNQFMDFFGMTLFPALCANLFYHYAAKRYGALPNIAFRLVTTLNVYFVSKTTRASDALLACSKMLLPFLMLALLSAMFEKQRKNAVQKGNKLSLAGIVLTLTIITSFAMLISCQFRYGAIVIATGSMTGEINKGDMIIYEEYRNQKIEEGQVIVFRQEQNRIIHRVVEIETVGNEVRYYTKGDANQDKDSGYRTEKDIVGLTDLKVPYVGYPTLWLRELLDSSQ